MSIADSFDDDATNKSATFTINNDFSSFNSSGSSIQEDSNLFDDPCLSISSKSCNSGIIMGRTSTGATFQVPQTHDMIRSLFDPRLKKSYGEILITLTLFANFVIYYFLKDNNNIRIGVFLTLYVFWRCAYNFGIGWVLKNQSSNNILVRFAIDKKLFDKSPKTSWLQTLSFLEIKSKMGSDYNMIETPVEFNTWLLFRQFVDLILMQDFTTYMFLVWCCGIKTQSIKPVLTGLDYGRYLFGFIAVVLNLWIKMDAHRVVKDYAWYWGDFFFLQDSELIFDGVFNLFPHPMYSVGYVGYYGFALITESYLVLTASLFGHCLQFVFLSFVEEPHIEKIYGDNDGEDSKDSEFLIEKTDNYLRPLIVFKNFKPAFRLNDALLLTLTIVVLASPFVFDYSDSKVTFWFFVLALTIKIIQSFTVGYILATQSSEKYWTKLYLANGLDNIAAFVNWQVIYNSSLVSSYVTLLALVLREILNGQYNSNFLPIRLIIGGFLIALQTWTSNSILSSIGEFGWFYGDFFLVNSNISKTLTKSGIYRYLNNPERFLGIAGVWGLTLISNSKYVFVLSFVWSLNVTLFISFVEKPHMIKVYGEQQVVKNVSGVSLTLGKYVPKSAISLLDNINNSATTFITGNLKKIRSQSESFATRPRSIPETNTQYQLQVNIDRYYLGQTKPLTVTWKAPSSHSILDWIGLYKVVNTGGSRNFTRISSMGKWFGVQEGFTYEELIKINNNNKVGGSKNKKTSGVLDFTGKLSGFEEGVYEFRYYEGNSHKVLSISKPFEISYQIIEVNSVEELAINLLKLINKINCYEKIQSIDKDLKNMHDFELILKVIRKSTNFDISKELVKSLGSLLKISERIIKAKKILEELNNPHI